ncbi:1-aminocyclopropane-1-carboxylate deaminase [Saccharata proteae CBS 121410]|uniref:1-aminocyclopropane-1-carboxylate deaminase n=1 Tax=Saccharata proteae CBS 121410 TaxID=1314787 RepID=A0A6A5YB46_9PEZI|nr:1-aminocyclopropane-1-carboxylate deaminase [Saccharata proteae CBS 121410]
MKLSQFPRHDLTFPGPTPIQPLNRLSAALGGKVHLYAKREDCNSGLAFGGNKTRKLEYLLPEALAGGYTHLVSIGGIQSNQTRQVAAAAAHCGLKCVLVQENWVNIPAAEKAAADVYDKVGNVELSRIMGADVRMDSAGFDIGIRPSWEQAMEDVRKAGGKPFPIPAGCSEHPYGGLGFVGFAEEVRKQEEELGFKFDYIVVCAVTGSTMAGMVVGFAEDGRASRVIGIDGSAKPEKTRAQVLRIAQNTAKLVELGREITDEDIVLDERFGGPEYGLPNDGTMEAIRLCARTEGMLTDPVYEGKSMDGMIQMVKNGEFPEGSRVLYAHLGGAPALSAYSYLFQEG